LNRPMLSFKERVKLMRYFRDHFDKNDPALEQTIRQASIENPWFTSENIHSALSAILEQFLSDDALDQIAERYGAECDPMVPNRVGIVMAGNIPFVGFHDLLSVFLSGHIAQVKLSSKDKLLIPFITEKWIEIDERVSEHIQYPDRLKDANAYIATGSDNSVRYFEAYFGKYPSIIRRNRNSVALLNGNETDDEILQLGADVFSYFGMGCRNVSKLYVPEGYTFDHLLTLWQDHFVDIIHHNSYKNNYDYCYTLYLLNKMKFLMNGCVLLIEEERLSSRISMLHYEHYKDTSMLVDHLKSRADAIQCVVGRNDYPGLEQIIPFGGSQRPGFFDYADGVDTMKFLTELTHE